MSGAQQQIGDQRLCAWVLVEFAVEAGGQGLAHRVDRLVEATEPLVGVGELVEVLGAVGLRVGQLQRARDQTSARIVVIALARDDEFAFDRLKISHAPKANPSATSRSPRGAVAVRRPRRARKRARRPRIRCASADLAAGR